MADLIRKQLYITRDQEKMLKLKSRELGVTEAEIVREALDKREYRYEYPFRSTDKWQEELAFINKRMTGRQVDQQTRTWRRDDLYDR